MGAVTQTPFAIERLIAVEASKGKQLDVDWLGYLVWSTITETEVTAEQLRREFKACGVDESLLPRPTAARDAFRKAVALAERRRENLGPDRYLNLMAREVQKDRKTMTVHLVREVVDSANRRLSYAPIAEMRLEGEKYTHGVLSGHTLSAVEHQALRDAADGYPHARDYFDGRAIRGMVTDILGTCAPVSVRPSGSVYFVPRAHDAKVRALQALVDALAAYGTTSQHRSVMRAVPVIDSPEQRAMVTQSLEEQVEADSLRVVEELRTVLASGRQVARQTAEQYVTRIRELDGLVQQYEELMATRSAVARGAVETAQRQAIELIEHMDD